MEIANRNIDPQAALSLSRAKALPRLPSTAQGVKNLEKTAASTQNLNKLRKTAQDFEAVFLGQMLRPMFDGTDAKAPFGGGAAEGMWKSLMIDAFGKSIAKTGGIGISTDVMREMLKLQEAKAQAQTQAQTQGANSGGRPMPGTKTQEVPNG